MMTDDYTFKPAETSNPALGCILQQGKTIKNKSLAERNKTVQKMFLWCLQHF